MLLAIALVPAAATHRATAFWILLGASLASDGLDGLLARRWRTTSDLGRRLDSAGDYVLVLAVVPSLILLWPAVVRRELGWVVLAVVAYFLPTLWSLLRWRTVPGLHTRASKAAAVAMAVALPLMLLGGSPVPFRILAALQVLVAAEELAILHWLPGHSGEVPSLAHARRHRHPSAP